MNSIFVGFEPREVNAFAVAASSAQRLLSSPQIQIRGIVLDEMRARGLYWRPTETRINPGGVPQLWDRLSNHWMSTEFAISRFLTPHLAGSGWALFMDCDMLARRDLGELFKECDPKYAVMCVQHEHAAEGTKMDGQVQTAYWRKNWSSVMAFNCEHESNKALTLSMINSKPGRQLHAFDWLEDEEIGALDPKWNYLVGHHRDLVENPGLVHFTDGIPSMAGYEHCEYAEEWRFALRTWGNAPCYAGW